MTNIIGSGAEAIIYQDGSSVIKDRIKKSYRLANIDERLRKMRTRRETKILTKLSDIGFPAPELKKSCDKRMQIEMDFIKGKQVKNIIDEQNYPELALEIAKRISALHNNGIIHGDLTTSNMILNENNLHFIDFGLSFFSEKVEDKAVDLHLLKQALESKHYLIWEDLFSIILKEYEKNAENSDEILKRFEKVELRGRYKHK